MRADARVEADAFDDILRVEALEFGVGVELVEVADAQGQVGVGEELHRFGLGAAHEEDGDVLLDGTGLQKLGEGFGGGFEFRLVEADDDAARIEVVVEGLAFAEELRCEDYSRSDGAEAAVLHALAVAELFADRLGVAHGDGGLDDHGGVRVHLQYQFDYLFHVGGVEEVFLGVVVGGGGDDYEVGVFIGGLAVQGGCEVQLYGLAAGVRSGQVLLDEFVLDRALATVDFLDLFRHHVHCHNFVVLRQKGGQAHAYVTGSCYCYFHIFFGCFAGICISLAPRASVKALKLKQLSRLSMRWRLQGASHQSTKIANYSTYASARPIYKSESFLYLCALISYLWYENF